MKNIKRIYTNGGKFGKILDTIRIMIIYIAWYTNHTCVNFIVLPDITALPFMKVYTYW